MSEHTPTPWVVSGNVIHEEGRGWPSICLVYHHVPGEDMMQANAEFIVRACNAHEALVAALEACEWRGYNDDHCPVCDHFKEHKQHGSDCPVGNALALARGEQP